MPHLLNSFLKVAYKGVKSQYCMLGEPAALRFMNGKGAATMSADPAALLKRRYMILLNGPDTFFATVILVGERHSCRFRSNIKAGFQMVVWPRRESSFNLRVVVYTLGKWPNTVQNN